jgi:hypothetical protein
MPSRVESTPAAPKSSVPGSFAWSWRVALACLAVAAAIAWVNRHETLQSGILHGEYQKMALFLAGKGPRAVISYPLWGYPALLAVLPYPTETSVVIQVLLAVGAVLAIRALVAPHVRSHRLLDVLCVAAVPWWCLASVRLADPYSAIGGVFAVVALSQAIARRSVGWAALAGVAFGLALNVRTDLLAVAVVLPGLVAVLAPPLRGPALRAGAVSAGIALTLLLPWGIFRVVNGAPFGITSTNAGMVLYNSLGFNGNAWGIVANDRLREQEVKAVFGPEFDAASPEGNRYLTRGALEAIESRPLEFVHKVAKAFLSTLEFGFYGIEVEPFLHGDESQRFEVLKEQLKQVVGAKANPVDIASFRKQGLWDEHFSVRSVPFKMWMVAALPIFNSGLSAMFLLASIAASAWIVGFDRAVLARPEVVVPLAAFWSIWGFVCLIQYEPRQINVLYVLAIPFLAVAWDGATARLVSRSRSSRAARA